MGTPNTAYKLVEYLVNIHLMLLKKTHLVIYVHFMRCVFCSNLKSEIMREKEDIKSEGV